MTNPTDPTTTRSSTAINAVARATLRRIAQERLSPTPESYARVYREIAATHPDHPGDAPHGAVSMEGKASATLIARLLTQLDAHHTGITITRKREGLKRALVPRLEPLDTLFARLNRLMDSWNGPNAEAGDHVSRFLGTDVLGTLDTESGARHRLSATQAFEDSTDSRPAAQDFAGAYPDARHFAPTPAMGLRAGASSSSLPEQMVSYRLAGLLAQLLRNIDQLTPESTLLGNQIEQIGRVLTAPLTEKKLDEAERCVRALIVRQGAIKHSLDETKRAIRDLAETLIQRLSALVTSTDTYSNRMVDIAEQIAGTNDLGQLSTLTQMLVADARLLSSSVVAERERLIECESRASALAQRSRSLEVELEEANQLVRTDPLTGAFNRRGFGDAYKNEGTRAAGGAQPVIALIDVDDFKRINEEYGHSVGDQVLCGVVDVLQRCAAPANTVARYGGEEFALMFPALSIQAAELALVKMQRALSEHLGGPLSKLPVVTFSVGLTQVEPQEALAQVMTRADRALRHAKLAGKNRIIVAALHDSSAANV